MISSIFSGLAAACIIAALPGSITQETRENIKYPFRAVAYNPYEKNGIYEDMRIRYVWGDKVVNLEAGDVVDWVRYWPDGHWDISDQKIAEFVDELEETFNTDQYPKILHTTRSIGYKPRTVIIKEGNYGWRIDREKETEELSQMLRRNHLTLHFVHFAAKAQERNNPYKDYGDDYIEIDLTRQKLWLYLDGEVKLRSDIVSGLMNTDRQTPGGAYAVYYKQSPAVLKGEDYETPVTYWMPFNGGIGLHDATWQPVFGGDACYYNGSHGCINLPYDAAEELYAIVKKGFPVLCYY